VVGPGASVPTIHRGIGLLPETPCYAPYGKGDQPSGKEDGSNDDKRLPGLLLHRKELGERGRRLKHIHPKATCSPSPDLRPPLSPETAGPGWQRLPPEGG
jgi:hypothetical protein